MNLYDTKESPAKTNYKLKVSVKVRGYSQINFYSIYIYTVILVAFCHRCVLEIAALVIIRFMGANSCRQIEH